MAPVTLILLIPTLSLTTAVNIIVWLCDEVVNETVESFTLKLLIDGFWSSLLVTVTVILSVELLPAASVAVNWCVTVFEPKLYELYE